MLGPEDEVLLRACVVRDHHCYTEYDQGSSKDTLNAIVLRVAQKIIVVTGIKPKIGGKKACVTCNISQYKMVMFFISL